MNINLILSFYLELYIYLYRNRLNCILNIWLYIKILYFFLFYLFALFFFIIYYLYNLFFYTILIDQYYKYTYTQQLVVYIYNMYNDSVFLYNLFIFNAILTIIIVNVTIFI